MKQLVKDAALEFAKRSSSVRNIARYIVKNTAAPSARRDTYEYLREKFIGNGKGHAVDDEQREEIVSRFERIDREVKIATSPTDGLFMAEMLLNMDAEGEIVECGCFNGGSSAKLSIIAHLLGQKFTIFDSFAGLPEVDPYFLRDQHCRRNEEWMTDWTSGSYAARLDEVRANVARYGEASVTSQVEGWFEDTMTDQNLPAKIAFAFVDVDLANSARDCFVPIWPRLDEQGIFVTHDTAYLKVMQEFYRKELWTEKFKTMPPILFGAGYGLCNESPHIGYMVKGEALQPDYLKLLTIDK